MKTPEQGDLRASGRRVLVVGTTPDYIDILRRRFPGRAVFVTDAQVRARAKETPPGPETELLCDLTRPDRVRAVLEDYVDARGLTLSGVACFDCESMPLAASLAATWSLPYPTAESIAACRSKLRCKQLWRDVGLPCPEAEPAQSASEAVRFMRSRGGPVVLKPLTGSGSELTFLCAEERECRHATDTLLARLREHPDTRVYAAAEQDGIDPRRVFAAEEFVDGPEYSCDLLIDGERLEVIRLAEKVPGHGHSFGTALAYVVPGELPPEIGAADLCRQLLEACHALGIESGICMLDFVVRDGEAVMLEIAPRPGGDCLPPLLFLSSGFDILGAALDLAEGQDVTVPEPSRWRRVVGLRLFAERGGRIKRVGTEPIRSDPRVLECETNCSEGDRIVLPPEDYDSRVLGHVVFCPSSADDIRDECREIAGHLQVEFETSQ